jgi:hypothetical protein
MPDNSDADIRRRLRMRLAVMKAAAGEGVAYRSVAGLPRFGHSARSAWSQGFHDDC